MSSPKRGDAPPTIEPAQRADGRTLAALYATAFSPDPVWSAIVPNNRLRPRVIRRSFSRDMRRGGYRHVDVVRGDDGEILAALNYASPSGGTAREATSPWRGHVTQIVREALPRLLLMAPSARRGLMHDQAVHACRPEEPHWYLRDLVTSPSAQGRGLGSALLKHRLDQIDLDPIPVFLESTTPGSKRLYERFGFNHVETVEVLPGGISYIMVRPATAKR